jgi:predicted TIM-barrel fold metal-dependent hydrolase
MWVHEAPYHDRRYDPVWALCEELQMPVVTHSGSASRDEYGDHLGIYVTEVTWWPARPMWFLLWSGVFKRFPGLRFGVTEGGCWWLPGLLWSWDRLCLGSRGASKLGKGKFAEALGDMLPSEVVDRNCFTGLANAKRRELGMRYEIGIDNMLWGTDFPHPEGTWPNTHEWLTKTFFDIPIDETRRMLGLAAGETFGFDMEALAPLVEKIGPTPTDLGQLTATQTAADLEAKWAGVKAVGRHWLTGHDFPLLSGDPN